MWLTRWLGEGTREPEEEDEIILQDWQLLVFAVGSWCLGLLKACWG